MQNLLLKQSIGKVDLYYNDVFSLLQIANIKKKENIEKSKK